MSETAFDTDIFVVGGGPAGLAAALAVRKRGFSVTVADHATPPIDKACGEGLMPDSLAVLGELGVKLNDVETGTFQGIKFIRDNCEASAHFPYGIGHGIRRTALHQRMTESAAEAGVRLCWGTRVDLSRPGLLSANGKLYERAGLWAPTDSARVCANGPGSTLVGNGIVESVFDSTSA